MRAAKRAFAVATSVEYKAGRWMDCPPKKRNGIRFEGGMLASGETSYGAYRFAFADQDNFPEDIVMALQDVRFFIAPVDGGIVSASGQLTDGDFLDCLAKIKSGSAFSVVMQ